jgi:hypothetical protein
MSALPVSVVSSPENWAEWIQAVLSGTAVLAAIGLAWWQYKQRHLDELLKERVVRLSAIGALRLAVGHITTATERCRDPIERARIARRFPFYALDQADNAIARFPIHLIGHEDGVELFTGMRAQITSAKVRLEAIQGQLSRGDDASHEIGLLINDARMAREELRKIRHLLAPGSAPLDANHPAELGLPS